MAIDKIGSSEPYAPLKRSIIKPKKQIRSVPKDTITLTKTAKQNSDYFRIRNLAMAAPDIRPERLSNMEDKLQNPAYPDEVAINGLADNLLEYFSPSL